MVLAKACQEGGNSTRATTLKKSNSFVSRLATSALVIALLYMGAIVKYGQPIESELLNIADPYKASVESSKQSEIINPYASLSQQREQKRQQEQQLKVALLISFPNSGTSYTLKNTRRITNISTASNYCGHNDAKYEPIWPSEPTAPQPHITPGKAHDPPKDFVLTKTHCNHCQNCPPMEYLLSPARFRKDCLTECVITTPDDDQFVSTKKTYQEYPISTVGKVVHLIRNPLDNIVSRFHCFMKGAIGRKPKFQVYQDISPGTVAGFKQFCAIQDSSFLQEEFLVFDPEFMELALKVPCHADFFRYINWHNHAFDMTHKWNRRFYIENLVIYYEDYAIDYHSTVTELLDFLEMPWVASESVDFYLSDYSKYYTVEEKDAITIFLKYISTNATWAHLQKYGFE